MSTGLGDACQSSSSLEAALASFKPTHKEVISGIAPHLFDERRRRRRKRSRRSRLSYQLNKGTVESSPLRVSAVITPWNEYGVLGHAERRLEVDEPVDIVRCASDNDNCDARPGMKSLTMLKIPPKLEIFRWRDFRIDIRVLKTIGIKLKPAPQLRL